MSDEHFFLPSALLCFLLQGSLTNSAATYWLLFRLEKTHATQYSHFSLQAQQSNLPCFQLINVTAIIACYFITLKRKLVLPWSMLFSLYKNCVALPLICLSLKKSFSPFLWRCKFKTCLSNLASSCFISKSNTNNLLVRF